MSRLLLLVTWLSANCIPGASHQAENPNTINGNWQLVYIQSGGVDRSALFPDNQPYMRLDSSTLQASGSTGCNRFSGQFVAVNQQFRFDMEKMVLTRMACKGPGEGIFLETIARVNRYRMKADTLEFLENDSVLIGWKKKN